MTVFQWDRFLGFAQEIAETEWPSKLSGAPARSAVSRAYYAAFHAARTRLVAEGHTLSSDHSEHGEVIRAFEQGQDGARRLIGSRLRALRERRREADYDDVRGFTDQEVREELGIARSILAAIRTLPSPT